MYRLFRLLAISPVTAGGIVMLSFFLLKLPALAPVLAQPHLRTVTLPEANSLEELYAIRERLQQDLDQKMPALVTVRQDSVAAPTQVIDQLQQLASIIQREETAHYFWLKAEQAAISAQNLGLSPTSSPEEIEQVYTLWTAAMNFLASVPDNSFLKVQATTQQETYTPHLLKATYYYETARSNFLWQIAINAGIADRVFVTVCNLQLECRRMRGNQRPASPASLIKVPIAVALMEKLHRENIDPNTPILVSRGNWTESLGDVRVGGQASLKGIMQDMLGYSSNIATNQLIDYIGWADLNTTLRDRGYSSTRVTSKLVGVSTYPANSGNTPNTITSDELTAMMVSIYNRQYPGDDLIIEGLTKQYDLALGHAAIRPPGIWLGEKTGRNSKVIGSTTALELSGQRYVITVIVNGGGQESAIRAMVAEIVEHLLKHNGFGPEAIFAQSSTTEEAEP
jgi:beta-lactamase class A